MAAFRLQAGGARQRVARIVRASPALDGELLYTGSSGSKPPWPPCAIVTRLGPAVSTTPTCPPETATQHTRSSLMSTSSILLRPWRVIGSSPDRSAGFYGFSLPLLRARASAADQSKPRWRDLAITVMTRSTTATAYAPAAYEVAAHSAGACFLGSSPDRR